MSPAHKIQVNQDVDDVRGSDNRGLKMRFHRGLH